LVLLNCVDLATSNLTQAGSVMGTPYYMSPEQCMAKNLTADQILQYGILLYESIVWVSPIQIANAVGGSCPDVTQAPAPLRSVNLSIPAAVEVVVLHALEKKREARPQTAKALAQEMKAAVLSGSCCALNGPTEANLSPVTASSSAFTPPGVTIPFVRSSSVTGSGDIGPRVPKFLGGQTAHTKGNRLRTLMLVGIALLVMGTAAGGVAGWMLWTRWENSKPKQEVVSKQPNEAPPRNHRPIPQATGSRHRIRQPAPPIVSSMRSAISAATRLRERPEIEVALKSAESKYPSDYRFTYERAKLSVSRPGHGETFNLLFQAGQKAIDKR